MENGRFEKRKMRTENADLRMRASTMELNRLIRMKVNLSVDWQLVFLARAKLFSFVFALLQRFYRLIFSLHSAARSCVRNLLSGKRPLCSARVRRQMIHPMVNNCAYVRFTLH